MLSPPLKICVLVLLLVLPLATATAQSPQYTVVDLGPYFYVRGINDAGQVVGSYVNGRGDALLYSNGVVKVINPPGASSAATVGINNRGDVVGNAIFCDIENGNCVNSRTRGFIYSRGTFNILSTMGGRDSFAQGINESGRVTGYSYTSAVSGEQAFTFKDGAFTDIGAGSGAGRTFAISINGSGQVVGYATSSTSSNLGSFLYTNGSYLFFESNGFPSDINNHGAVVGTLNGNDDGSGRGYLFSGGVEHDLGTLNGGSYASPSAINDLGQVVGRSGASFFLPTSLKAFIYSGGTMQDLNTLIAVNSGWVLGAAVDINDAGQIVANGRINGEDHGFLLTPTQPMLLTQSSTNKALALQSVMFLHDPFGVSTTTTRNLSSDTRTRITFVVRNMETLVGENIPPPTVQAEDSLGRVFALPVEFVSKVPGFGSFTQITASLPDEAAGRGDIQISVSFRGHTSNKAVVTIQ
jgi:probable HAF family extracellular repeat protein